MTLAAQAYVGIDGEPNTSHPYCINVMLSTGEYLTLDGRFRTIKEAAERLEELMTDENHPLRVVNTGEIHGRQDTQGEGL